MNHILRTLLPCCEASTRTLLSGVGASGVLHVLVGAALATWFGSMAPYLFPPQQGFNSIRLTASQTILVEAVEVESETSPPVVIETSAASDDAKPTKALLDHETSPVIEPLYNRLALIDASATFAVRTSETRRSESEAMPDASSESNSPPRTKAAEPPSLTQTSVASMASEQDAGQLDAVPTQIYSPQPDYPVDALQQRLEGRVVLRVKIDANGRVAAASVLRSSGHPILDDAARQAVLQWRFDPPRRFGLAIATEIAVPVRFRIEDE